MELGGRLGAQDLVDQIARQVGLERLLRVVQRVDVEDEVSHGGGRKLEGETGEVKAWKP